MEQIKIDVVKQWLKNKKEFSPLEVIETLEKENAELKEILSFEEYREQFQKGERKLLGKTIKEWLIYQNENERLIEQVEDWKADHKHNLELMKGLNGKIAELKMQIEKMKNCSNCKHLGICFDNDTIQSCIYQEECEHHEKWELAE